MKKIFIFLILSVLISACSTTKNLDVKTIDITGPAYKANSTIIFKNKHPEKIEVSVRLQKDNFKKIFEVAAFDIEPNEKVIIKYNAQEAAFYKHESWDLIGFRVDNIWEYGLYFSYAALNDRTVFFKNGRFDYY